MPGRCVGGRPGWSPPPTPGRGLAVPSREGQRPQGQRSEAQESACLLQACLTSPSPDPVALKQDPGNGKPAACMSRVSRAGIPPRGAFPEDILGPVPGLGHPRGHFRLRVLLIPLRRTSLWWAQGFLWLGGGACCPCPRVASLWRTRLSPKVFRTDAPDPRGDLLSGLACRWAPHLSRGLAAVPVVGMARGSRKQEQRPVRRTEPRGRGRLALAMTTGIITRGGNSHANGFKFQVKS